MAEVANFRPAAGAKAAFGMAEVLSLAAAPTFAVMALLTSLLGSGPADLLCATAQEASPLGGMVPMYLLMSMFHSGTWLKMLACRKHSSRRRDSRAATGD
ncbi:hypothetical protein [Parvibaculum sp.]|uniref:hypothetical protein n=1 Tax=Parvibaculum sp. TaxID=2024848 RepID=UPI002D1CA17C|nr:hypothetical protein [Parvibaculum sp.]HUD50504.1 hypothetical protein [Parvibaculum sp.]